MKKSNGGMNLYKKPFIKNKLFSYANITQQSLPKGLPAKHTTPGQNIQHPCPAGCPASTSSPPCCFMVLWEAGPQLPPVPCSHTGSQSWSRSRQHYGPNWAHGELLPGRRNPRTCPGARSQDRTEGDHWGQWQNSLRPSKIPIFTSEVEVILNVGLLWISADALGLHVTCKFLGCVEQPFPLHHGFTVLKLPVPHPKPHLPTHPFPKDWLLLHSLPSLSLILI